MNHQQLDRALCEKLGIEPTQYPALSTSEAGFSILWQTLKRNGWSVSLSDDADGCWARVSKTPSGGFRSNLYDSAPRALAMAAAAALGIEVA